jgi:hypothetical protein
VGWTPIVAGARGLARCKKDSVATAMLGRYSRKRSGLEACKPTRFAVVVGLSSLAHFSHLWDAKTSSMPFGAKIRHCYHVTRHFRS